MADTSASGKPTKASKWKRYKELKLRERATVLAQEANISFDEALQRLQRKAAPNNSGKSTRPTATAEQLEARRAAKEKAREIKRQKKAEQLADQERVIQCQFCGADVRKKNFKRHVRKVHPSRFSKLFPQPKRNAKKRTFVRIVSGGGGPGTGKRR
jgi:hypothetical protein